MYVRIQKVIADAGIASRRAAEELIKAGEVSVNGKTVIELGFKVDPEEDQIKVGNKFIPAKSKSVKGLLMLHKPVACLCSKQDKQERKLVYDFVPKQHRSYNSVGRLDYNTSGLLLFTNNGDLANKLTHPSKQVDRVYRILTSSGFSEDLLKKIEKGIFLKDGKVKGEGKILSSSHQHTLVQLTLQEGRNRVVRRIFKQMGFPVKSLSRQEFGPFKLGKLKAGEFQIFTKKDYEHVLRRFELDY